MKIHSILAMHGGGNVAPIIGILGAVVFIAFIFGFNQKN